MTYKSSDKAERGFCSNCGSSLTFQFLETPDKVEIFIGSIDEEWLCGRKVGEKDEGEFGKVAVREEPILNLCSTELSGSIWVENAVPGVTDRVPGPKWWRERADGTSFDDVGKTKQS
jgi:hypothetical protein